MQTSLLVVPQAFIECEVRVYDKRGLKDRIKDDQEVHQDLRYNVIKIVLSYNETINFMHYISFCRSSAALIKWKINLMKLDQATYLAI